jgi:hypothetical protein
MAELVIDNYSGPEKRNPGLNPEYRSDFPLQRQVSRVSMRISVLFPGASTLQRR